MAISGDAAVISLPDVVDVNGRQLVTTPSPPKKIGPLSTLTHSDKLKQNYRLPWTLFPSLSQFDIARTDYVETAIREINYIVGDTLNTITNLLRGVSMLAPITRSKGRFREKIMAHWIWVNVRWRVMLSSYSADIRFEVYDNMRSDALVKLIKMAQRLRETFGEEYMESRKHELYPSFEMPAFRPDPDFQKRDPLTLVTPVFTPKPEELLADIQPPISKLCLDDTPSDTEEDPSTAVPAVAQVPSPSAVDTAAARSPSQCEAITTSAQEPSTSKDGPAVAQVPSPALTAAAQPVVIATESAAADAELVIPNLSREATPAPQALVVADRRILHQLSTLSTVPSPASDAGDATTITSPSAED